MKRILFLLSLLLGLMYPALHDGAIVYQNGSLATVYYDVSTETYADGSITNPNLLVRICADAPPELLGKFVALYYRSGELIYNATLYPVNITSLNASNCADVDVDISLYHAFYPGIMSIGVGDDPSMSNLVLYDLNETTGLFEGSYEFEDLTNATHTILRLRSISSSNGVISSNHSTILVAVYNSTGLVYNTTISPYENVTFEGTPSLDIVKFNNITGIMYLPPPPPPEDTSPPEPEETVKLDLEYSYDGYLGDVIDFYVSADGAPVDGAKVTIYDSYNLPFDSGYTDSSGYVTFTMNTLGDYYAVATHNDYNASDKVEFSVALRSLSVEITNSIYVGENVSVNVFSDGNPVSGAEVKVYSPSGQLITTLYTDSEGKCEYGPLLDPGEYRVAVSKSGYSDESVKFEVYLRPLSVDHPSSVKSGEEFSVRVVSLGDVVEGATVELNGDKYDTDSDGRVTGLALESTGRFKVLVYKDGYQPYEGYIEVELPSMSLISPENITLYEPVMLRVVSSSDDCIGNVRVIINGTEYKTDENGYVEVVFESPGDFPVRLVKPGCKIENDWLYVPELPPEFEFEKGFDVKVSGGKSVVDSVARSLGISYMVKSGCEGVNIPGLPFILCDLIWVLLAVEVISGYVLASSPSRKLLYAVSPLLLAVLFVPMIGVFVGGLTVFLAYRNRLEFRHELEAEEEQLKGMVEEEVGEIHEEVREDATSVEGKTETSGEDNSMGISEGSGSETASETSNSQNEENKDKL